MNSAGVGRARANRYRAAKLKRFTAHKGRDLGFSGEAGAGAGKTSAMRSHG
jgi:hypothetical protein